MGIPLYQLLAQEIAKKIADGLYLPGEKLPSIRRMKEQKRVSVATVQEAYKRLENQKLIYPKPKSGYIVRDQSYPKLNEPKMLSEMSLPQEVSVHELSTKVFQLCEKKGIMNLGVAYPSAEFLPAMQLQKIMKKLIQYKMPELVESHFTPGYDGLRHQLSLKMMGMGCDVPMENLIVTNGCQEALNLCLRAVAKPGDTIAIESPTFVGLLQAIEALGMKALEIPTHPKTGISLEALEMALEQWKIKACALVPTFNNPLGSNMPESKKEKLIHMLAEKNIPLIEDDLFGDLYHQGKRTRAAKSYDKKGLVLYCSSVSKSIAPGFRVGWVAPGQYHQEIEFLKSYTSVGVSTIAQYAIAEFMSSGAYDRHLRNIRKSFAHQIQLFSFEIQRYFPEGTEITRPEGGFVLWVGLLPHVNALELQRKALKYHIGIIPGEIFSSVGKYQNFFRMNCAIPWSEKVRKAIHVLGDIAKELTVE